MASNSNSLNLSQSLVPIFNGENYVFWSIKMKTFFVSQDLWDLVENGFAETEKSPAAKVKDLRKKDAKALLVLQQAITDSIFPRIANATKSKEAWTILNQEFYGDDKVTIVKLQTLRKELENLCMKGSELVQDFFSRVFVIINQLKTYGDQVDDRKVVEKVLRCLPSKFDHVVAAIEESKDFSVYSLNQLMGSLLAHEERMNRFAEKNMEQAFQTKVEISSQEKNDHRGSTSRGRGVRSLFRNIDETVKLKVRLGDNKQVQIEGKGTIAIRTNVGQLVENGYLVEFHDGLCEIKCNKSDMSLAKIPMAKNKMFPLEISCLNDLALVANVKDDSKLWHMRYGHLHFNGLKLLSQKKMVYGLPSIIPIDDVCEGCVYGKQHKNAFPIEKAWRAKEPLESQKLLGNFKNSKLLQRKNNGVAERKNRTVVEMARSMLNEKKLPQTFWAEAAATAVHILNISPTKAVRNMTPYEAWWKRKPNVSSLRVFGCISYAMIASNDRTKMDQKSEKCIFVGYSLHGSGMKERFSTCHMKKVNPMSHKQKRRSWLTIFSYTEFSNKEKPWEQVYDLDTYALLVAEPTCYDEAYGKQEWENSMKEEIDSIEKNNTWELVDKPEGKTPIGVKWVYRVKYKAYGSVQKYKARLVAKGYVQKHGIDFLETFSPVARFETVRLVIALAAQMKWKIFQFDVKSTFLNGWLEEDVYVEQPEGFIVQGKEEKVYKLKKALYGLKQAPRAWYGRLDSYLHDNDFHRNENEPTLYVKVKGGDILIICVYVDDIIYTGSSNILIEEFKKNMSAEFDMSDLGLLHYFLGLQIYQTDYGIFVSQEKYALDLLKKFNMQNCKMSATPMNTNEKLTVDDGTPRANEKYFRSMVGRLMYLTHTRPDIMFSVSLVSRFMHNPSVHHLGTAKRILCYIRATSNFGIWYKLVPNFKLLGFIDSDWASSVDDRKSTSGYIFNLGSGAVSWSSKKQECTALSSSEAEYVAASSAACQAIWMRRIMKDLQQVQEKATKIFCDNKATILMTKNPVFHGRTKHIELRQHFIRGAIADGLIALEYCSTSDQLVDGFTKGLCFSKFMEFRNSLGVAEFASRGDVEN
ncbi:hypothetical protein SLEP1_g54586 [Rubroshorea leprosula]|uniref:Retrovirus-related Pol polyprotein from transposon TNT 1-94 n=1 Tax=Rubroshorea leprosula TaxID=152421 RepID=A0AAV5ME23_9ROSI|nr:hypothetical protein SLEP1_g54586 [Rubroshorea leprosula]